ncbi:hypothetical protein G5C51_27525 [Streptomyces sp. A7024]|uniref:Uncharacterized protein n=1 Tax=Streptomyces coryli TaxID=1128680 RepID=A0A6G4U5X5_9ACTN|nr:hypothetical protein [Streptomyces coryli]NGN67639.1 hypothetical protein [Streptomyces coryli]
MDEPTLDALFVRRPERWGLRGDPVVWQQLQERLRGRPIPGFLPAIGTIVESEFAAITGVELPSRPGLDDHRYLRHLATGSGMSDGTVSLHFWRHTALPILIDRAAAARSAAARAADS